MIYVIEQSSNICAHDPADLQRSTLLSKLVKCLMLTVPPTECMGKIVEIRIIYFIQDFCDCSLYNLILKSRNAYRPSFPPFLVYPYPSYRCGNLLTSPQSFVEVIEVFVKIL